MTSDIRDVDWNNIPDLCGEIFAAVETGTVYRIHRNRKPILLMMPATPDDLEEPPLLRSAAG